MKQPIIKTIYVLLIAGVITSCGAGKKISNSVEEVSHSLPAKEVQEVLSQMQAHETHFTTLSAKGNVSAQLGGKTYHMKASLRMQDDSVIWLSVSASFGIEVARLMLTPDSVFYLNRLERSTFKGSYAFLSRMMKTDVDFDIVQSLLTGRDVRWYDHHQLKAHTAGKHIQLVSAHRRRLKRYAKRNDGLKPVFYQSVWLAPQHYKIEKIKMKSVEQAVPQKLIMEYGDFKPVGQQHVAHEYALEIAAEKPLLVDMRWKQIKLNQPTKFPFKVPASYKKIVK